MFNKLKAPYIRLSICKFLPIKLYLKLFNKSKYFQNILNLSIEHYKFYKMYNNLIIKDTKNHLSYFEILAKKFPSIPEENLKLFFFEMLRECEKVQISLKKPIGIECLNYLNLKETNYLGKIIVNINNPLKIIPIINQRVNEIYFRRNLPDYEEKESMEELKEFIIKKIENISKIQNIIIKNTIDLEKKNLLEYYNEITKISSNILFNVKIKYFNQNFNSIKQFNQINIRIGENFDENKLEKLNQDLIKLNTKKLLLDISSNNLNTVDYFLEKQNNNLSHLILYDFIFYENKKYIFNFQNIKKLGIIQRIYGMNPLPFLIELNEIHYNLKELYLEKVNSTEETLCNLLKQTPNLTKFSYLKNYSEVDFTEKLAFALNNLQYLQSLSSNTFSINKKKENVFYLNLKSNSLKKLSLNNDGLINMNILSENLPNLQILNMYCINSKIEKNKKLNFKNLFSFTFYIASNSEDFIKEIVQLSNLQQFDFEPYTESMFRTLLDNLNFLNKIKGFYLSNDEKSNEYLKMSIEFISKFSCLNEVEELRFSINYLDEELTDKFIENIKQLKKLNSILIFTKSIPELLKEKIENELKEIQNLQFYKLKEKK